MKTNILSHFLLTHLDEHERARIFMTSIVQKYYWNVYMIIFINYYVRSQTDLKLATPRDLFIDDVMYAI